MYLCIHTYRPRLTKDKKKFPNIQVDWSMWVDEDEEGKEMPGISNICIYMIVLDFGGMGDMGAMGGMPGMGGMGDQDFEAMMSKYKAQGNLGMDEEEEHPAGCGCGDHDHKDDSDDESMYLMSCCHAVEMPDLEK